MYKCHFFLLLLTQMLLANIYSQSHTSGNVPAGQTIYLSAFDGASRSYTLYDSTQANESGEYLFSITNPIPNLYQLELKAKGKIILSIMEDKNIIVNHKQAWEVMNDPRNQAIQEMEAKVRGLQTQYFGQLKKAIDQAMANGDQEKAQAYMKEANEAIPLFVADLRALIDRFGATPAAYLAMQFSDFNKEQLYLSKKLLELQEAIPNSPVTLALAQQLEEASSSAIGKTPPMIKGKSRKGAILLLDTFKGKYLLVDFWASWCRACRIENPKFKELYELYEREQFEILSISSDENEATWEKAIITDEIGDWHHIQDSKEIFFKLYGVSSLPQNVVLNPAGIVIAKNVDAETLEQILREKLK